MKHEKIPCRKIIEALLLEHRKSAWKVNQKIPYKQFLPYSKKFVNKWINANLFGPTQLMMSETMKYMSCPKTLQSQYKKFHSHIWTILADPTIREQIELDSLFCYSPKEIYNRLNDKIKPRIVDILAIKQFQYYFWNLEDENGVFRSEQVIGLIESSRELTRAYGHILKYCYDKLGREKYEKYYRINNPKEPDITNIITVIDLTAFDQIDALDKSNFDKLETLTNIQLKNSIVLKTLKTISDSSGKQDLSDIFNLKDEENEK